MATELGDLVRAKRIGLGYTLQDLARLLGYRNADRGARRLSRIEEEGRGHGELVARVAAALGIAPEEVVASSARDEAARCAELEAHALVPEPMKLLGVCAGVTFELSLPDGLSEEAAMTHALAEHEKSQLRVCLVLDRRRSFWISNGQGRLILATPDGPNFPYTTVR